MKINTIPFLLIIMLVLSSYISFGQYFGGIDDGFTSESVFFAINEQSFYCNSADGDGYSESNYFTSINEQIAYCNGGDNDGASQFTVIGAIYPLYSFQGGSGDGYDKKSISIHTLGNGIWLGDFGPHWSKASNWTNGVVPDLQTNVFIPQGRLFYPHLSSGILSVGNSSGYYNCARMYIDTNALLQNNSDVLVAGELLVNGELTLVGSRDSNLIIENNGSVIINGTAEVKVGDEIYPPATSDLIVKSGGQLIIHNGSLSVNDQLVVLSGGSLEMDEGEIIVHDAGFGSALTSNSYTPFYVASGALGGISGGDVVLSGKNTVGNKHTFMIIEPLFEFSDSSYLYIRPPLGKNQEDCGLFLINGSQLNNLTIETPYSTTFIESDVLVDKKLRLLEGNLVIKPGKHLSILDH